MEKTVSYAFRDAPADCNVGEARRSTEQKEGAEPGKKGAFGAFLRQECVNKQLAYALLKHPTAVVNTLLESWARYLASPQYQQETRRAQMVDKANAHAVNKKRRQVQLKLRVHRLRHQIRRARALDRRQSAIMSGPDRKLYQDWRSGKLDEELDECTRAHGYGKLDSTGEFCRKKGLREPQRQRR